MRLRIESPEGVAFHLELAGPMARFLAWIVDMLAVQGAILALTKAIMLIGVFSNDLASSLYLIGTFAITLGYGIALEWRWSGQTLGKRVMRIQVMDEMGLPLGFGQVFLRNTLRVVDTLPAFNFVGGVSLFLSPKQQRLGDLAARTVVIKLQDSSWLDTRQIEKGKYNSLFGHARCTAALRQSVSPEFAALALQCLLRRDELEDDARVRLFRSIRDDFQAAASFPEEATFGLSDENYVRSAVELLFASRAGKPS